MTKYFFLQEDLEVFDRRIGELKRQVNELSLEAGEATRQSAETWHDNFPFEEGIRQYRNAAKRLQELVKVRQFAHLVESVRGGAVGIGKKVTVRDETTDGTKEFLVGSYMVLSGGEKGLERLSYEAPFVKIVMGAKAGEVREGKVGNRERVLTVIAVE